MAARLLAANIAALDQRLPASLVANQSANETALGGNLTQWITREEVEHFLGDPDVLHAVALVLGIAAIAYGRRLPHLLAAVSSVSLGLWVGLVIQDRQAFNEHLFGKVEIPEGTWFPIVIGLVTTIAAGVLGLVAWRAALVLLTACLLATIALAICRLANASPERILKVGASLLSAYRIVGAVVLVIAILASTLLVKRFHKAMIFFSSAHLGTLLLLSGISHFSERAGAMEAPFSLLDDLARVMAEVRGGRCHLWKSEGREDTGLKGCDCGQQCRTDIIAWLVCSATVLGMKAAIRLLDRRFKGQKPSDEEKAPLADGGASPQVIGAALR
mmetsp:Transcript_49124/g.110561  ORF Transcript_49124/g.110561 Transcript_49124/m.110561 type:complete len:330 (+) Transcript_49124:92-1081(+)|eukprot:CAMPEP_0197928338 /NCGR_PEP_ID=MMETSP1439-20131203/102148_1 /TAXON_ID=66791 /ORGANISM="Gonyaulax spinifera, Strain CCMP409" /LENGTH=329 /DNA_ID=CAMNT_0043550937 /DNA_START=92 /DNA_END=1081 /DNA_ORIENTATION=-